MIVVDSSVWIDYFNGIITQQTDTLDNLLGEQSLLVGDIILSEVLQGFRSDSDFEKALQALGSFEQVNMLSTALAVQSAYHCRSLRKSGIAVRKTIDCLIATYCIIHGHSLLHSDKDFDPFEQHLGLQVV